MARVVELYDTYIIFFNRTELKDTFGAEVRFSLPGFPPTFHRGNMFPRLCGFVCLCALVCGQLAAGQPDDGKRYICRAVPLSGDVSCPVTLLPELNSGGQEEELRNTVMQLRETILQQKENISKQQGTINELTTKLSLCAAATDDKKYDRGGSWGKGKENTMGDVPRDPNDTIESLGKTMQGLKDRLENLEVGNLRLVTKGVPPVPNRA